MKVWCHMRGVVSPFVVISMFYPVRGGLAVGSKRGHLPSQSFRPRPHPLGSRSYRIWAMTSPQLCRHIARQGACIRDDVPWCILSAESWEGGISLHPTEYGNPHGRYQKGKSASHSGDMAWYEVKALQCMYDRQLRIATNRSASWQCRFVSCQVIIHATA